MELFLITLQPRYPSAPHGTQARRRHAKGGFEEFGKAVGIVTANTSAAFGNAQHCSAQKSGRHEHPALQEVSNRGEA
jgi:hypothetical protein